MKTHSFIWDGSRDPCTTGACCSSCTRFTAVLASTLRHVPYSQAVSRVCPKGPRPLNGCASSFCYRLAVVLPFALGHVPGLRAISQVNPKACSSFKRLEPASFHENPRARFSCLGQDLFCFAPVFSRHGSLRFSALTQFIRLHGGGKLCLLSFAAIRLLALCFEL